MCIVILVLIIVYKHTTTIITTVTTTTTLPHLALFPDPAQLFVTCSTVLCADENSAGLEMRLYQSNYHYYYYCYLTAIVTTAKSMWLYYYYCYWWHRWCMNGVANAGNGDMENQWYLKGGNKYSYSTCEEQKSHIKIPGINWRTRARKIGDDFSGHAQA